MFLSHFRLDQENRSVAHYLAWIGCDESLQDFLSLVPTMSNFQDIYGETPLMLAVRSSLSIYIFLNFFILYGFGLICSV